MGRRELQRTLTLFFACLVELYTILGIRVYSTKHHIGVTFMQVSLEKETKPEKWVGTDKPTKGLPTTTTRAHV